MNFAELVNETLIIVKRPDLNAQIESSVRAATLKAHGKEFFYRDIVETGIEFTSPDNRIRFEPKLLYPRFRKPAYVRMWIYDANDITNFGRPGADLKCEQIGNLKDGYGYDKENIYYMAGDLLQLRSNITISHILFGSYQYPDITSDGFSSWIADEFPEAIYREAARSVFKSIGFDEQATEQANMVKELYQLLTINGLPSAGS